MPEITPVMVIDTRAFNDATVYGLTEPRSEQALYDDIACYPWIGNHDAAAYHKRYVRLFTKYLDSEDAQQWARQRRARIASGRLFV